jgi:hypothetical protein
VELTADLAGRPFLACPEDFFGSDFRLDSAMNQPESSGKWWPILLQFMLHEIPGKEYLDLRGHQK